MAQPDTGTDHSVRISSVFSLSEGLWIHTAVLTMTRTGKTFEVISLPCVDARRSEAAVLRQVRELAGIPSD